MTSHDHPTQSRALTQRGFGAPSHGPPPPLVYHHSSPDLDDSMKAEPDTPYGYDEMYYENHVGMGRRRYFPRHPQDKSVQHAEREGTKSEGFQAGYQAPPEEHERQKRAKVDGRSEGFDKGYWEAMREQELSRLSRDRFRFAYEGFSRAELGSLSRFRDNRASGAHHLSDLLSPEYGGLYSSSPRYTRARRSARDGYPECPSRTRRQDLGYETLDNQLSMQSLLTYCAVIEPARAFSHRQPRWDRSLSSEE